MFKRFFLGRGLNRLQEISSKFVRHGLGVVGGVLIGKDIVTSDQWLSVESGALVLVAVGWSLARTFLSAKTK